MMPKDFEQQSHITTDHRRIRRWMEVRKGHPARIQPKPQILFQRAFLKVNFPGPRNSGPMEAIGWDEFFDKFEQKRFAFLYNDRTPKGHGQDKANR